MFERFTDRARRVVVLAQEEARLNKNNEINAGHILLGVLQEGEGVGYRVLDSLGVTLARTRQMLQVLCPPGEAEPPSHIAFTDEAKKLLELALREALQLGHNYIGTEHVLLAVVRQDQSDAAKTLSNFYGISLTTVRQEIIKALTDGLSDSKAATPQTSTPDPREPEEGLKTPPEHHPFPDAYSKRMWEESGRFTSNETLTAFIFVLLRDYVQPGDLENIVALVTDIRAEEGGQRIEYANGWLAQYAENIADRLIP